MFGFGEKKRRSAESAKNRLKLVLVTDRAGFSQDKIIAIRKDILEVLARHLDIDVNDENLDINIIKDRSHTEDGETKPALIVNVPINGMKDR